MAKVLLKKSSVPSNAPGTGDLEYGEVAINYADGRLYYKNSSNVIKNFVDSDLITSKIGNTIQAYDANLTSFLNVFNLTDSDGSDGYVLTTDGAGNLTFTNPTPPNAQTLTVYEYTADSGQTTYVDSDDNSNVLSYTPGNLVVSLNGVILRPGEDYTASNGTSLVLTSTPTLGDDLQIISFSSFSVSNAVTSVTGTGTVSGITLSGNITNSGNLTLGGTLSGITSSNFAATQTLVIYDSSGTPLKTIYSPTT